MPILRVSSRRLAVLALVGAVLAGACGDRGPTPSAGPASPVAGTATPSASTPTTPAAELTPVPSAELTPVPGAASGGPVDPDRPPTTTVTEWGTILDDVPEGFPVFPGAAGVDPFEGPASRAWEAVAGTDEVATWYVAAFEDRGWSSVDLGSALEDGTRVLDLASDLPECRVQVTFRPIDGSTIITVLYGAGCAGGDG